MKPASQRTRLVPSSAPSRTKLGHTGWVFLNGRIVREEEAVVSVFDRGFLYGDGLFETMRVYNGQIFRWHQHLERMSEGAQRLAITLPIDEARLSKWAADLICRNHCSEGLLRLMISRGRGPRGYSPRGAANPTLVMTTHEPPPRCGTPRGWRLITSSVRVPKNDDLARFKTSSKLPQILARLEAEQAGADEALLLNTAGEVTEAASANLFWINDGCVLTPPLHDGVLEGITRSLIFELCSALGVAAAESSITAAHLAQQKGIFLTASSFEIKEATSLDGRPLQPSPLTQLLRAAYRSVVQHECGPLKRRQGGTAPV